MPKWFYFGNILDMTRLFSIILFLMIIIAVFVGGDVLWQVYLMSPDESVKTGDFKINEGEGVNQISKHLYDGGFIKSIFVFETYVWKKDLGTRFLAGDFALQKGTNIKKIVEILTSNSNQDERQITIIEGWDLTDIGEYFNSVGISSAKDFYAIAGKAAVDYRPISSIWPKNFSSEYDFLRDKPTHIGIEGYIFPDTYRVFRNASVEEIIKKALDNFSKKFDDNLRQETSRQGKTIFEIVTMASVLEQEVKTELDKKMVSDIFWRRIKAGMSLQSDATVNYITRAGRAQPTYKDLETDSPFNTYKYRGLPLGPICNPGLVSLRSSLYPEPNNYWYFLTTPEGQVIYSRTYDEHLMNKARYLP